MGDESIAGMSPLIMLLASLVAASVAAPLSIQDAASVPASEPHVAYTLHPPISIVGDSSFDAAHGVTSGSGTPGDPYVIEGWEISAYSANGIDIRQTNASFAIRDVYIHSGQASYRGINLVAASNARVEGVVVTTSFYGVSAASTANLTITTSSFVDNMYGVYVYASDGTVVGNSITGSWWGVDLQATTGVVVRDNRIAVCSQSAIRVGSGASGTTISGNWLMDNGGDAVHLENAPGTTIEGNLIAWNVAGIYAFTSSDASVTDNIVQRNVHGIAYHQSTNVTLLRNTILGGSEGVSIADSLRITIEENVFLRSATGLAMYSSGDIRVVHNNFVYDDAPAFLSSDWSLTWDDGYPSGGNYWSAYGGVDACGGSAQDVCVGPDGIGDTPETTSGVNDAYPLMYASAAPERLAFFGNATSGWGLTPKQTTNPGIEFVAVQGLAVNLLLVSSDGNPHLWFLDLNDDSVVEAGEPASPAVAGGSSLWYNFTPSQPGLFRYRCGIHPSSMAGPAEIHPPVAFADRSPPSIVHTPVAGIQVGQAIVVKATVSDALGLREVALYWHGTQDSVFKVTPMTRVQGDEYTAGIPEQERLGTVQYYIEAVDLEWNTARSPPGGAYSVPVVLRPVTVFGAPPIGFGLALVGGFAGGFAGMYIAVDWLRSRMRRGKPPGKP